MRGTWPVGVAAVCLAGCAELLSLDDFGPAASASAASSTAAGTAGAAGAGGAGAGGAGEGGAPGCPPSRFGPTLVRVGGYCIDATEVTEAQYRAWLDTMPPTSGQHVACAQNTTFWNLSMPPLDATSKLPVAYVDWCDAHAFCTAAGKRLCGRIGGGQLAYVPDEPIGSVESEWYMACTNGGATEYPYGDMYDATRCNGLEAEAGEARAEVTAYMACHGHALPYAKIFDMSGNIYEWEDACSGTDGATDTCHRRGGSFRSPPAQLACNGNDSINFGRLDDSGDSTGFRCCTDAP